MFRFRLFFISLLIVSSAFSADISGRVYQQKTKKPMANVPMRLHVYKNDYEFSGVETKTDKNGQYRFHNLQSGDQYAYLLYPIYEGVNYPYQEAIFSKGPAVAIKDFEIVESTGSTENIFTNESIFFEFGKKDIWKVTHEIFLENKGDLLYHWERSEAQPLLFSLFEGGFDLSYLDGITRDNSKIDEQKDTLQALLTLQPHQTYKIKFSYYYLPDKRHVTFDKPAFLQRSNMSLFFKNNVRVVSTQFQSDPMMAKGLDGITRAFTSGPIKQSEKIKFEIKGFFLARDFLHFLVLGGCLVFIIFILVMSLKQKKAATNRNEELTEEMYRYLIGLRKQHKDGIIDELQYKNEDQRVRNFLFQLSRLGKK